MASKNYRQYYVDIDALMDTRLGTLFVLYGEEALKIVDTNWRTRISDEFDLFLDSYNHDEYSHAWTHRDRRALMCAWPTNMFIFIHDILAEDLLEQTGKDPDFGGFKLTVNHYPYQLEESEKEAFKSCVALRLDLNPVDVELRYIPYSQMNAQWLKQASYTAIILYNLDQWLGEAFKEDSPLNGNPDTVLLAPLLFKSRKVAEELREADLSELPSKDPTELLRMVLCTLVHLRFAGVEEFTVPDFNEIMPIGKVST